MNIKFFIKLMVIITIIVAIFSSIDISWATNTTGPIDPTEDPNWYAPSEENSTQLSDIGKTILAVINVVGVVVAVISLSIIGLRYMFGSIEERANYKETMVPYIIGLVMLGGITTIVNIIYNIASNIGK